MRWLLCLLPLAFLPDIVSGQSTIPGLPPGFSIGGTVDQYYLEDFRATAISVRGIGLAREQWTAEIGLGAALTRGEGEAFIIADLGTAYNMPLPGVHVLAEGGMTGIFAARGPGGGLVGAYVGLGLVARIVGPVGLRAGASRRWFLVEGPVGINVLSVGLTLLPRAAAP